MKTHQSIKLTLHQKQLIAYCIRGFSHKMMALCFHTSIKTIYTEVKNIKYKLGLHHSAQIPGYALTHGFTFDFEGQHVYYEEELIM